MRGGTVRKQILVVASAVLVIAVGLLAWFVFGQRPTGFPSADGRSNLLFSVLRADGARDVITVLSLSSDEVFALRVPQGLRLRTADGAYWTASQLDPAAESGGLGAELAGLLGVEIPHYIELRAGDLSSLVNELGGLTVTSDEPLLYFDDSADLALLTELAPGTHRIDGETFIAVLLHREDSEPADRIERQRMLLWSLLERLFKGSDSAALRAMARNAYPKLVTDLSPGEVLALLDRLREAGREGFEAETIPGATTQIGGERVFQLRPVELERTVAARIKGLDLLTPGEVRVAVFNGNGVRLMARRTADYLEARGFVVNQVANAESFDYATSYIVVLSEEEKAWILRDALPSSVRIVLPENFEAHYRALRSLVPDGTDVMLIAGAGMVID